MVYNWKSVITTGGIYVLSLKLSGWKATKPAMKAAYIEESLYVGDEQLDAVINIKSKQVLLGELIATLQSPMQNVLSGLKGQGAKIAGILKTLEERTA